MMALQRLPMPLYAFRAGAKSSAGFGDSQLNRRTLAPTAKQALFLRPLFAFMVVVRGRPARSAGFLFVRFANLRTATPKHCLATVGDGSIK